MRRVAALAGLLAVLVGFAAAYALYAKAAKDPLPGEAGRACRARCGTASTSTSFTRPRSSALHDFLAAVADWFDRWIIAGLCVVRGTHGTTELVGPRVAPAPDRQPADLRLPVRARRGAWCCTSCWKMNLSHDRTTSTYISSARAAAAPRSAAGACAAQLPRRHARRGACLRHVRLGAAGGDDVLPVQRRGADASGYQFEQHSRLGANRSASATTSAWTA